MSQQKPSAGADIVQEEPVRLRRNRPLLTRKRDCVWLPTTNLRGRSKQHLVARRGPGEPLAAPPVLGDPAALAGTVDDGYKARIIPGPRLIDESDQFAVTGDAGVRDLAFALVEHRPNGIFELV